MELSAETDGLRVFRSKLEVEALRDVWARFDPMRDADLDLYLFIADQYPSIRPHVIVAYEQNEPRAILLARIEEVSLPVKLGHFVVPIPKMRIMQFIHYGILGNVSSELAKLIVISIIQSLAHGEAEAAAFQSIKVDSPLVNWARSLPGPWCSDFVVDPVIHRARELPTERGAILASLSQNERYQQRKRARRLGKQFSNHSIKVFSNLQEVAHLVEAAERVAAKTYQRNLGVGFVDSPKIRARLEFEASKGWLRGHVLFVEDRPCAFWIGSVYRQSFISDYLGFDPAYGEYAPGMYLILSVLPSLCEDPAGPVHYVDFGGGDAPYKERLGNLQWEELAICIFAPNVKSVCVNIARNAARSVNFLAKGILYMTGVFGTVKRLSRVWKGAK